jgi:hypothetical protein
MLIRSLPEDSERALMSQPILTEVNNFNIYPDGRLRAGPFTQDRTYISRLMARYDLKLGEEDANGICSKTAMGTMISSSGIGVKGYLIGLDDLEAPSSDLEAFLEEVVDPGVSFSIEGHHCPDKDTMIKSSLSAWRMNDELMVSSQRVLERRGESRLVLHQQAPTSVSFDPESAPGPLRLVG